MNQGKTLLCHKTAQSAINCVCTDIQGLFQRCGGMYYRLCVQTVPQWRKATMKTTCNKRSKMTLNYNDGWLSHAKTFYMEKSAITMKYNQHPSTSPQWRRTMAKMHLSFPLFTYSLHCTSTSRPSPSWTIRSPPFWPYKAPKQTVGSLNDPHFFIAVAPIS